MTETRPSLPVIAVGATALMGAALFTVFFVAEQDADQGLSQKIFFFHVPIALTAYGCFGLGAWKALRVLWTRGERYDLESYTAIHQGTIFGALTGGFAYTSFWGTLFLAVAVGAILQVVYEIGRFGMGDDAKAWLRPSNLAGLLSGLLILYVTRLAVPI